MDDDNIQKQIEAKKKRLEELKQKRLQRQQKQDDGTAASSASSTSPSISTSSQLPPPSTSSPSPSPRPTLSSSQSQQQLQPSTDDILDVVNSLITTAQPAPPPAQAAAQLSAQPIPSAAVRPALSVAPQPSVSVAAVDLIVYEIATQTNESYLVQLESEKEKEAAGQPHSPTKPPRKPFNGRSSAAAAADSDSEGEEVRKERDVLRQRETELMTTIKQLKSQVEQLTQQQTAQPSTAHTLSTTESEEVMRRSEFVSFFSRSSLLMERALEVKERRGYYDFTVDYALEDEGEAGKGAVETLVPRLWFEDAGKTGGRPVSALDWSPKHPELLLAAYASTDEDDTSAAAYLSPASAAVQQGCVLVWNVHLSSRPEYAFTCDSSILCAAFHPTQPKLLLGASASGQLLLWDARARAAPVNRTGMGSGHSFPVYGMRMHANQLVSVSSDGYVCHWQEENWHVPSNAYVLRGGGLTGELSVSCMDIAGGVMYVGADDGCVYKAKMHADRDGEHVFDTVRAHDAPVSSLSFQPSSATSAATNSSALYLTSSYDWTVKLWAQHTPASLGSFESSRDYTYDAAWHPTHPGLFVCGDSSGQLDVWRLGAKGIQGGGGEKAEGGGAVDDSASTLQPQGWEVPQFTTHVTDAAAQPRTSTDGGGGEGAPTAAAGGGVGRTHALSKLRWHGDGSMLSVGTSAGGLSVYELNREVMECSREEAERLWDFYNRSSSAAAVKGVTGLPKKQI